MHQLYDYSGVPSLQKDKNEKRLDYLSGFERLSIREEEGPIFNLSVTWRVSSDVPKMIEQEDTDNVELTYCPLRKYYNSLVHVSELLLLLCFAQTATKSHIRIQNP